MTTTDRRFGSPRKFGTGTTFGASSFDVERLLWNVSIDWDGDGVFDGTNEGAYLLSLRGSRGRTRYVDQGGNGFERISTGRYSVTLDNESGRFDAWNTSSPLYPNVTYGKEIRITVRDTAGDTTHDVFYGVIQDIRPNERGGQKEVTLTAVDGFEYLRNYTARYAILENINPETAIGHVLDVVRWPTHWGRAIGASSDTIRYWWADGNKTAASVIEDVTESFLGYFYIAADGKATYKTRADITTSGVDLYQTTLLKDITLPQPWENSRNFIRIKVHPRLAASSGVIWQLAGNKPSITTGRSLEIWGNYTYSSTSVPAINIVTPAATTDYTMNTAADGSGTDKTADCTVTVTNFGDTAKLVVRNGSAVTVYVTKLQLRGEALYEPNVSDVTYQGTGYTTLPREFKLDLPWQQDVNVAVDFTGVIGPFLAERHPYPVVQIEAHPELQFAPDLFDLCTLSVPALGIDGDSFRVAGIEHETIARNGQAVRTKFTLESYVSGGSYWTWDTYSAFDTETIFGA